MTSAPVPKITGQSSLDSPLPVPEVKATMRLERHHPDGEVDVRASDCLLSSCLTCALARPSWIVILLLSSYTSGHHLGSPKIP